MSAEEPINTEAAAQGIIAVTPVGGTGYSENGLALAEALLN